MSFRMLYLELFQKFFKFSLEISEIYLKNSQKFVEVRLGRS
jgi:hypothetical protein